MPSVNFDGANAAMAPLSPAADHRNLFYRIISGVVLGPLVLVLAFLRYPAFEVALALATAIGLGEWLKLVTGRWSWWPCAAPFVILSVYWFYGIEYALYALAIIAVALGLTLAKGIRNKGFVAFGLPYVGLTMLSLAWLHDPFNGGWPPVFFVFFVVWSTDIGAYAVGRSLKGPRLAPSISPNKTWSGFFGGLGFAAIVALCLSQAFNASRPVQVVEIAIGLSLLGQGGDLFESAMKRRFGVKDSGNLIPGHGGMLDRIDALLWAAPSFALLHSFGLTAGLSP
jgi:phosphatidate cytidylyltransferase